VLPAAGRPGCPSSLDCYNFGRTTVLLGCRSLDRTDWSAGSFDPGCTGHFGRSSTAGRHTLDCSIGRSTAIAIAEQVDGSSYHRRSL